MEKHTETTQEIVKKWNDGDNVWSAELGGIGPGYEQCIQLLLFEILTLWGDNPVPEPDSDKYPQEYDEMVNKAVHELNKRVGGFTGAQVGAAKATAYQFLKFGYSEMMNKLEDERHILVSKKQI